MLTWGRRLFVVAAVATALGLTACGANTLSADPKVIADTDAAFQELTAGNDKALLARLPPEVSGNPGQVRLVGLMRQLLPPGKPGPYDLIGWRTFAGTGGSQHTVVLRYAYDNGEHITTSALFEKPKKDGPWQMMSINIKPSDPQEVEAPAVATKFLGDDKGRTAK